MGSNAKNARRHGAGAEIGGEFIRAGRGEKDCRKYRKTARAIEPPSDVGSALIQRMIVAPLRNTLTAPSFSECTPTQLAAHGDDVLRALGRCSFGWAQ
jgi:hypothetical protein